MEEEFFLTKASFLKIKEELEYMKTVKRAENVEAIKKARSYGDLSENFEYHSARRDQGILNGKIAELERQLELAVIVSDAPMEEGVAGMGTIVEIRDLDLGDEWAYTLVDSGRADPLNDLVNIASPVGQALEGKRVGDIVAVSVPDGVAHYEIIGIRRE